MSSTKRQKLAPKGVIIVTGPTAVGKTELSLKLAERLDGEIISADSVQVYRALDIGSDKVTVFNIITRAMRKSIHFRASTHYADRN